MPQSKKQRLTFRVLKPRQRATLDAFKLKLLAGVQATQQIKNMQTLKLPFSYTCPEEKAHQEHCHQGQSFMVAWLEEAKPHF